MFVEILSLEHDSRIGVERKRQAGQDHGSTVVVGEIDALADLATTNGKHDRARVLFVVDAFVEFAHRLVALFSSLALNEYALHITDLLPLVVFL